MNGGKTRPFSIRIFLPDGLPEGIRIVEKSNWTGIGVVVPRSLLPEAKAREEFSRTGVYVLVGHADENDLPTIYVGQGDPIRPRLERHLAEKDFWTWAVFFVTRDNSLNKAHIGYLEASLIRLANQTKRAKLDNQNAPQPSALSEPDAADMDSFLADMLSILPLVGLTAFEKPRPKAGEKSLLHLTGRGIQATGYESPQGFVVQENSTAVMETLPSIQAYQMALRKQLTDQRVLVNDGPFLKLTQDYVFSSSTTAAAVLLGRAASGPAEWENAEGKSLREIQKSQAAEE
jgi:hypothetical protein